MAVYGGYFLLVGRIYFAQLSCVKTLSHSRARNLVSLVMLVAILPGTDALTQTLPSGFSRQLVSNAINSPSAMVAAPDGRLFVTRQTGELLVIKNGALLPAPFVTLTVNSSGERGLIGIVLDPDFQTNGYVYVYHTVPDPPIHNRITRFTANGDVAAAGSETIIFDLDPVGASNHNGGGMAFGTDGKLYVGVGDNANGAYAQSMTTYFGKILRINKEDGTAAAGNPYPGINAKADRFWGIGLRNPYAMSVHPQDGRIFLLDVGANSFEEINDITIGGKNYGWNIAEGNSPVPGHTNPVYAYAHGTGDGAGCAITGGTFFMPSATNYPSSYYGKFFFMDYCEQWINSIDPSANPATASPFATGTATFQLFVTTGADGNLYYLSRTGSLYRIAYTLNSPPFIISQPVSVEVTQGEDAIFTVSGIGTLPFFYQWYHNGAPLAGATGHALELSNVDAADAGTYTVQISNAGGLVLSTPATLTVQLITGVAAGNDDSTFLYPNPATAGTVRVRIYAESMHNVQVRVLSMAGKSWGFMDVMLEPGVNHLPIDVSQLHPGLYMVKLQSKRVMKTLKMVVGSAN